MAVQLPAGVDRAAPPRAASARPPIPWAALVATYPARHPPCCACAPMPDRSPTLDCGRAVALALDRNALAALFADAPTAHLLPPGVAGSVTATVPIPDPARARALVGRRTVTLVFARCRLGPACQAFASLLRTSLRRAGIIVRVRRTARHPDLTLHEQTMMGPDPLGFLAAVGGPRPPSPRPAPARAAALARRLDAQLTRNGNALAFGTPTVGELASARLGYRAQLPLSFGDDLAALCPQRPGQ